MKSRCFRIVLPLLLALVVGPTSAGALRLDLSSYDDAEIRVHLDAFGSSNNTARSDLVFPIQLSGYVDATPTDSGVEISRVEVHVQELPQTQIAPAPYGQQMTFAMNSFAWRTTQSFGISYGSDSHFADSENTNLSYLISFQNESRGCYCSAIDLQLPSSFDFDLVSPTSMSLLYLNVVFAGERHFLDFGEVRVRLELSAGRASFGAVPEPSTAAGVAFGLAILAGRSRRQRAGSRFSAMRGSAPLAEAVWRGRLAAPPFPLHVGNPSSVVCDARQHEEQIREAVQVRHGARRE